MKKNVYKKRRSFSIIFGIIIMILGLACFLGVLAYNSWDISALNTRKPLIEENYVATSHHESINIESDNDNIEIISTDAPNISVKFYANDKEIYTIDETNGFTMTKEWNYEWYEYMLFFGEIKIKAMVISVPLNYTGDINVHTTNGKITVRDLTVNTIDISTYNGVIDMENIVADDDVSVSTSNGMVEMTNVVTEGNIDIDTSNGMTYIIDCEASGIDVESNNGIISANNLVSSDLIIKTSNGKIILTDIKFSSSAVLKTSNGSISGTIAGDIIDFNITSKTSNGNNNLPSNQGGGSIDLSVNTSNGKIDIEFIK